MKLVKQPGGFTIVETLIVLAVTGLLFIVAIVNMTSYLDQNSFTTALNDLQQQLQSAINKSASGEYDSYTGAANYTCTPASSHPTVTRNTAGPADTQGSQIGCEFVGTALRLGADIGGTNSGTQSISFYPLVINECTNTGLPPCTETITDLTGTNSYVTGIEDNTSTPYGIVSQTYDFENGLQLIDAKAYASLSTSPVYSITNPISHNTMAVVFGYAFNSVASNTATTITSTLYPFSPGSSQNNMDQYFNGGSLFYNTTNNLDSLVLCVASGNQYATITIGDTNTSGSLGVSTQILSGGATC